MNTLYNIIIQEYPFLNKVYRLIIAIQLHVVYRKLINRQL